MPKFRKKPVVIEAWQWTGALSGQPKWIVKALRAGRICLEFQEKPARPFLMVNTLEGTMAASEGDWIIQDEKGEIYPIKDEIFKETYEPVEEHPEGCCEKCGGRNIRSWYADSDIWNQVAGQYSILCPICFSELAEAAGISPTAWHLS